MNRSIKKDVDAAQILWRPLGAMLVERGLLTDQELEEILAVQEESGRRLGEIIVDRGLISGPTLAHILAEQWGVELTTDEGFGTGLRNEIQRRHEGERRRRPRLRAVPPGGTEQKPVGEPDAGAPESPETADELRAELDDRDSELSDLDTRLAQREARVAALEEEVRARQEYIAVLEARADTREEARIEEAERHGQDEEKLRTLLDDKLTALVAALAKQSEELKLRFSSAAETLAASVERRGAEDADVVARLDRIEELFRAGKAEILERFEAQEPEPEAADDGSADPVAAEHLVFLPAESGYALMSFDCAPPPVGARFMLGEDELFVVTKVARSPLPGDERLCAYLQRLE